MSEILRARWDYHTPSQTPDLFVALCLAQDGSINGCLTSIIISVPWLISTLFAKGTTLSLFPFILR
ncbi:hypothetical protein BDV24DRAFT_133622 [Aspergillus arachidicola]|uniref:Uncharacterized protein n=1 Tax=Aspergillus arachidicola TaxID=656916 RepID=A0A5N6Y5E8_9EURO|nr:hypothetical protein BDV24DRAFT_133622 [Aspergillus arachidicola]